MKFALPLLAVVFASIASAQTLTAGPVACGPASTNLYCYGIPLQNADGSSAGSVWIDDGPSAHFLQFSEALGTAAIDTSTAPGGTVSSVTVEIHGVDATGTDYTGTATFTFAYRKSASRYGGMTRLCTGGTVTIH